MSIGVENSRKNKAGIVPREDINGANERASRNNSQIECKTKWEKRIKNQQCQCHDQKLIPQASKIE